MKRFICLILVIVLIFTITFSNYAHAEALTVGLVAGAAAALMVYWGISFNATNATGQGMSDFFSLKIQEYVDSHGGSLTSLFIGELAVDAAGKLIIPYGIYNGVVDFVNWLSEYYDLTGTNTVLSNGSFNGAFIGEEYKGTIGNVPLSGLGVAFWQYDGDQFHGYMYARPYINGEYTNSTASQTSKYRFTGDYKLFYGTTTFQVVAYLDRVNINSGGKTNYDYYSTVATNVHQLENQLSLDGSDYDVPDFINPSEEWVGDVGAVPDTNLDQLIGDLNDDLACNDIIVSGEIVEPEPPPTPRPTTEPATDVLGGINDLIGQGDNILEGIDNLNEGIGEAAQAAAEAAEAAQAIAQSAGAIEGALEIVDASELPDFKFDLSTFFPFCIPFDIARILNAFDGVAVAPHVSIPIVIPSINFSYTMDLDFSTFDPVATILRQVELLVFAVVLAYSTSKVIRW